MRNYLKTGILFFSFIYVFPAHANNDSELLAAIANSTNKIMTHLQGKWETTKELLFSPTPAIETTVAANNSQQLFTKDTAYVESMLNNPTKDMQTHTEQAVYANLTTPQVSLANVDVFLIPGSDFSIPTDLNIFNRGETTKSINPRNIAFNIASLTGPMVYQTYKIGQQHAQQEINEAQLAESFIKLATGNANPIRTPDLKQIKRNQYRQLATNEQFRNYIVNVREYTAAQSIGVNNFYHIYAKRQAKKDLGAAAGLPKNTPGYPNASPLQVEDYLAKKRTMNPEWYAEMESSPPTTLMREMVYLMAEMRYEMYQLRLQNELLLATLSSMQLQSLDLRKATLSQQSNSIEQMIKDLK